MGAVPRRSGPVHPHRRGPWGGSAVSTTVNSGGLLTASDSGTAISTTINYNASIPFRKRCSFLSSAPECRLSGESNFWHERELIFV
jgi:hypothetical protein